MTSDTFSSSLDYLLEANLKFQYNIYYDNFCAGYTREQTKAKLKHDLNECVFDIRSVANPSIQRWLQEQLENDIPLASSTQVDAFWVQLEEKKQVLEAAKNEMIRKKRHLENMHSLIMAEQAESSTSATPSIQLEEQHDHNVIEGDTLLLFNGRSISSILKSKGKRLFQNYQKLNASEKILCAYCLNGILDLSRTSLQKPLFTEEQWTFLYKTFTYNEAKHLPHLQDPTKSILAKVKKLVESGQYVEAYHAILLKIPAAPSDEKYLYKILGHILNCYVERTEIFQVVPGQTELNYMSKVWFELFELTFGNSDLCLKWGESVSPTTTLIKLVNNGKKPNTIGCKVDGRILVKASETLDLCHIEASKAISPAQKTLQDKAKLAIETKCTLDDILSRTSISASPNCHIVPNMQLSGLLAYVHSLKLVDAGLYTYSHGYDLSLPTDVLQFSDIMVSWCRKLKLFKATCQRTATIHTSATGTEKSPASQHLQMRNWVRGTFIPPASGPPHFPKNFLSSPSPAMCTTSTLNIVDDYELDTLQDGTIVQRRKRQQVKESSSEKRKSSTSEKAEKKHARHKKDKSIKRDKGKSKAE